MSQQGQWEAGGYKGPGFQSSQPGGRTSARSKNRRGLTNDAGPRATASKQGAPRLRVTRAH